MSDVSQLVSKAQAGDLNSYEALVRRFEASAFGHAFSILGDSQLAQDAVQEAFIEAYRNLNSLKAPEAFATWFQKLVFTACSRMTRRNTVPTSPIEEVKERLQSEDDPINHIERREREQMVHNAIQNLPDSLRAVTGLYYISSLPQREVAAYLDLSETAVKKRLFNARQQLKRSIMNISKAISDKRMPAEQVSMKVIAELVRRPQPMLNIDHPIRQIVDEIQNSLPKYEMIEGKEVEGKSIYPSIDESYSVAYEDGYHLDEKRMLRTQLSGVTLRAIEGKQPPLHFLTAGRVFRTEQENEHRLKVFHQLDGICLERNVSLDDLHSILNNLLLTVLGNIEIRYRDNDFGWVDQGFEADVKMDDRWVTVAGGGMLKPAMLLDAAHDPELVSGYAFGMGLERLAMLKLGLKSIDELWSPCYLQSQT